MRTLNTKESIETWLKQKQISNYTINENLTVDVDGDVDLGGMNYKTIPVKFNFIDGNFNCANNKLTNTDFMPEIVTNTVNVVNNKISQITKLPSKIGINLLLQENNIDMIYIKDFEELIQNCVSLVIDSNTKLIGYNKEEIDIGFLHKLNKKITKKHFFNNEIRFLTAKVLKDILMKEQEKNILENNNIVQKNKRLKI